MEYKLYGSEDFEYTFLEDDIKAMYTQDRQTATIYSIFASIAIIISSLGLLGISLFDIRQRYREIAIPQIYNRFNYSICHSYSFGLLSDKYLYSGFCSKGTCQYRHFYHIIAVGNNHITGHLSIPSTKGGTY